MADNAFNEEAARAFSAARYALAIGGRDQVSEAVACFYGRIIMRLSPLQVEWHPTIATNGQSILYNTDYFLKQPKRKRIMLLCHESLHAALGHTSPSTYACLTDQRRLRTAKELAINSILWRDGFSDVFDDGIVPELRDFVDIPHGLSVEGYYKLLENHPAMQDNEPPDCALCIGDNGDPVDPEEAKIQDIMWRNIIAEAAEQTKRQFGNLPAGITLLIDELLTPKVNWRMYVSGLILSTRKSDFSWSTPNRRMTPYGFYLPTLIIEEIGHVVMAFDTSMSITAKQRTRAASEAVGILEGIPGIRATFLYHDAIVYPAAIQTWEPGDPTPHFRPVGGGGTSHKPVFEWVDQLDEPPAAVFCFTDMVSSFPSVAPNYPVVWVTINRNARDITPPFGTIVHAWDISDDR